MTEMPPFSVNSPGTRRRDSFTLVEMLVAMTTLVILLAIIGSVAQNTEQAIHVTTGKLNAYASARAAFDVMNQKLAQATLNTYMDYYGTNTTGSPSGPLVLNTVANVNGVTFIPVTYGRVSNLQFVVQQNTNITTGASYGQGVYFECPVAYSLSSSYQSLQGLLNACGYYVQYGANTSFQPSITTGTTKYRYRLMQAIEPTESLTVVTNAATSTAAIADQTAWTANIANTGVAQPPATDAVPIADNVIALLIWPRESNGEDPTGINLAPDYTYDSQLKTAPTLSGSTYSQGLNVDQLPPILQVTMVVIDESSAARIDTKSATPPAQIETALAGKFQDVTKYQSDLTDPVTGLETILANDHIQFEVLNTSIVMRESKWSQ